MSTGLNVSYLGIDLQSPVIVGSCPLTSDPETVRQLVVAGAGAVVLPSMLQEQITYRRLMRSDPLAAIENSGYQPHHDIYNGGTEAYLRTIEHHKSNFRVPVFASLSAAGGGDWLDYACEIEAAGADALELNLQSVISQPSEASDQVENNLCEIVQQVCASVSIPVAVKLRRHFTNLAAMAHKIQGAGASGLILFAHTPHWDVSVERMHWTVRWELSPVDSLGGTLEGLIRAQADGLPMSIAASGGVRTAEDATKAIIAGADVVMVTSELYRSGPDVIRDIVDGLARYIAQSHYGSLQEFQQARPAIQLSPQRELRMEHVAPLTSTQYYFDPTPVAGAKSGDAFGHPN